MPRRVSVLSSGQVYHVFNRAIDGRKVFRNKRDLRRAVLNLWYYRFHQPPVPLSRYLKLNRKALIDYHNTLIESSKIVEVYCYCLMPNHFHMLVRQLEDGGVSRYLANIQNGYTRFYNLLRKRKGALFMNQFKAVRVETDEQLLHVSRYIHLNPLTGYLVDNVEDLVDYEWSSLSEYLGEGRNEYELCDTREVLDHFKDVGEYADFVHDQAGYQRNLARIKDLSFE